VNTTTTDEKGVYYINIAPGKHTIEASSEFFIFNPLTLTVTEEMRTLPTIVA